MISKVSAELQKGWASEGFLKIKNYFKENLGSFYSLTTNRLMLYPFIFTFFLIECSSFWYLYLGTAFVHKYTSFILVYSLHKAAVYSLCILGIDIIVNYLFSPWGAFKNRTIGRQWLIWSAGLILGFILQRTMVNSLIIDYAPEVIHYFVAHPDVRLSITALFMILMPYWFFVLFITMQIARSKQKILQQAKSFSFASENNVYKKTVLRSKTKRPYQVL